jgi:hypothetical protein
MRSTHGELKTGWAQASITPDRPVLLAGQFHARVSEGVLDPVTATALAIESVNPAGSRGQMVMVSCDLADISDELRDAVRARLRAAAVELDPRNLFIGATHAHSAPDPRLTPYGTQSCAAEYKARVTASGPDSAHADKFGMWPCIGLEVMPPADYVEFAADRIAAAIKTAWDARQPSGIAYGLGHAVVGRNRRLVYQDGSGKMYGQAGIPEFRHVEGYEDHSVYAMMTYDRSQNLTGIVVNVPCPAQVSEHIYKLSADNWHETRGELRRRFGAGIFVLPQCAPAGDQSPHVLIGKRAEARMWRLKGRDADQNAPRAEIALKIADAVSDIVPYAQKEIDWSPRFEHRFETLPLPRRLICEKDVQEALDEARPFKEQYRQLRAALEANPDIRKQPRWYTEITKAFRRMERGERVRLRFELQKTHPDLPIEIHVARLGDIAFATNPFELYLDYAVRIRELSKAVQTFLIQKAGASGTYLTSERAVAHKGYGTVPASTDVGPEGGDQLVEWTTAAINGMW